MSALVAELPSNMRILPPKEAIPLILDHDYSPVVSLDTEYDASLPVSRADLRGLSLAGGTPETGYVGTFFSFANGLMDVPWPYLRDKVLRPLMSDPDRTMVMHPPKVDMQPLRARGLRETLCRIECTFSMVHLYDENLPKGLKDLGEALLGIHDLLSHAQTVSEMKKLRKRGEKLAKAILKQCWEVYRDERKRSKVEEVELDPSWPSWKRVAMALPPKMKKADVLAQLGERVRGVVERKANADAAAQYARYGAIDALITIAIRYFFVDGIPEVIDGLGDDALKHLPLETEVCHPIVTEMEEHGCKVDVAMLGDIHAACQKAISELEDTLRQRWAPTLNQPNDPEWNPGSPDQVGEIVWNRWGLRPPPWAQSGGEIKPQFRIKKTGLCSTSDDVLSFLVKKGGAHADDIQLLLDWRGFTKIFGTYVEPMLQMALKDPEHRLHSSFWPVGARTGRFSSSEPNLENIPRPFTMPTLKIPPGANPHEPPRGAVVEGKGKKIKWRVRSLRDIFISEKGYRLVSADLAQIENRLIAHESQDPTLLKLFRAWDCADCGKSGETNEPLHACPSCGSGEGARDKSIPEQPARFAFKCEHDHGGMSEDKPQTCTEDGCGGAIVYVGGFCLGLDIHAMTAHALGLVEEHGFKEGRQRAKADNHAFNYGMGANTLARREGMKVSEAQTHLDGLDRTYPRVRGYLHPKVMQDVREYGQVVMFDGHVRRFYAGRLLMNSDNFKRWEWEGVIREAVNVLAQGGTGVIMKRAMIAIRNRINERAWKDSRWALVKLINQVHDELLYEAPEDIADDVLALIIYEMEHAAPELLVPVIAEGDTGVCWGDVH